MTVRSYRDLNVWRLAMDLAEHSYHVTKAFPRDELFGMTSQIRRAAASVPANIAEGQGRHHTKEFLYSLNVARGSLMELETHLMLSQRVGLLTNQQLDALLGESETVKSVTIWLTECAQETAVAHATQHTPHVTTSSRESLPK
jgi:four helix bundle protein